jgi:hypothetical protein
MVQVSVHLPFVQSCAPMQRFPQEPQLFGSVDSLTHTPPHEFCPGGQAQVPFTQVDPGPQATPHAPQLKSSLCRFTQALLQLVRPPPQLSVHWPSEHTSGLLQAAPHPPQLAGFVARSTHWLPQNAGFWPWVHAQLPAVHCSPPTHALPHLPQLPGSMLGFTHAPLQSVRPVAHVSWQLPTEQTCPVPQAMPHPPQFIGSDRVSTHAPLQSRPITHGAPVSTPLESGTVASMVGEESSPPASFPVTPVSP